MSRRMIDVISTYIAATIYAAIAWLLGAPNWGIFLTFAAVLQINVAASRILRGTTP